MSPIADKGSSDPAFEVVETVSTRLTGVKHKIRDAGTPFAVPQGHLLPEPLDVVLTNVYLTFIEGWRADCVDLAAEAIGLGRSLVERMPEEPEALGLLGLMLLSDSRRAARFKDGELVLLGDQDQSLWNEAHIAEGRTLFESAIDLQGRGPYVIQAVIAGLHFGQPPDWREIRVLYEMLLMLTASPIIEMHRAVAVAETHGPDAALEVLDTPLLDDYRCYHLTRADLLRRLGRNSEARIASARALELARRS